MQHDSGITMWHRLNAAKVLIAGGGGLVAEVHTPGLPHLAPSHQVIHGFMMQEIAGFVRSCG
jgi:hypothetical protein